MKIIVTEDHESQDLISIGKAAARLDVSSKTVRRNFELVKIGGRSLVRVSDLKAKVAAEGPLHG